MIFSLQRFLEDSFGSRGFSDPDQYAVKVANLYFGYRWGASDSDFLTRLGRIRTKFYRANCAVDRRSLERRIVASLDQRFKGTYRAGSVFSEASVRSERRSLRGKKRRLIGSILRSFQRTVQGRTVDLLWDSRKDGRLRSRPEAIAQGLLSQFISGVLMIRGGKLFRELRSGVGYIDLVVMLGTVSHLVELKVQRGKFVGPGQLGSYMVTEGRSSGWLVIFDARVDSKKAPIQDRIKVAAGTINVIVIDINPIPPSRKG
jgi:hypothetical protein